MAEAARRAGRRPEEVELVAVTKFRTVDEIRALIEAGQRVLGENRVQEALDKMNILQGGAGAPPVQWHFIGHLQTNKVKKLAGRVALFHGVDSLRLAEALQRACDGADCTAQILLEVNVSGEASKYGLRPEELEATLHGLKSLNRIRCLGFMTMAPWVEEPEATRPVFRRLRELRQSLAAAGYEHADLRHLSMGMTNDFEVAIEEGATMVRIGTALFQG